jgi:carbonic anhydrase/acetyltransferase-like protein (isoleucine patch superfamily)
MILNYLQHKPEIHPSVYVAPSADIIGKVKIGAESSVWFQVVVRGDVNTIEIGERTNIQDQSCLHVTRGIAPLIVGDDVTVGHRVTLHGCTIKNRVLVGMGATIMDHAVIEEDSMVGAGSLVTIGKKFPPRSLIMGAPAKVVRELTEDELAFLKKSAKNYVGDARDYLGMSQQNT